MPAPGLRCFVFVMSAWTCARMPRACSGEKAGSATPRRRIRTVRLNLTDPGPGRPRWAAQVRCSSRSGSAGSPSLLFHQARAAGPQDLPGAAQVGFQLLVGTFVLPSLVIRLRQHRRVAGRTSVMVVTRAISSPLPSWSPSRTSYSTTRTCRPCPLEVTAAPGVLDQASRFFPVIFGLTSTDRRGRRAAAPHRQQQVRLDPPQQRPPGISGRAPVLPAVEAGRRSAASPPLPADTASWPATAPRCPSRPPRPSRPGPARASRTR